MSIEKVILTLFVKKIKRIYFLNISFFRKTIRHLNFVVDDRCTGQYKSCIRERINFWFVQMCRNHWSFFWKTERPYLMEGLTLTQPTFEPKNRSFHQNPVFQNPWILVKTAVFAQNHSFHQKPWFLLKTAVFSKIRGFHGFLHSCLRFQQRSIDLAKRKTTCLER